MSIIGTLPSEIVDLIANELPVKDAVSCLLVSRLWHDVFERVIYRTVDIRFRGKFMAFSSRLMATAEDPNPLGHYVRELSINDGFLTMCRLRDIKKLCPFADTLTFRWISGAGHDRHMESRHMQSGNSRRYFGTPERILGIFSIRKLKLVRDVDYPYRRMEHRPHDPVHYLKGADNVRELSMIGVVPALTPGQMDAIHLACPKLTHLCITVQASPAGPDWNRNIHESRQLDGPGWISPARSLQHIRIEEDTKLLDTGIWLRYFSVMYPNLRSISMSNPYSERLMQPFDEGVYYSPISYTVGALLADRCPGLKRIKLDAVPISPDVTTHMFAGTELQEVVIEGGTNIRQPEDIKKLVDAVSKTVTRLELSLFLRVMTGQLAALAACEKLVELKLVEIYGWVGDCAVSLDWLVQSCPMLSRLTLAGMKLDAFNRNLTAASPRLKSLELSDCSLCCAVMRYLSGHCPNLINLSVIDCKGPRCQVSAPAVFRIHLKSHNLHNLTISRHQIHHSLPTRFVSLRVLKASPAMPEKHCEVSEDDLYDENYMFSYPTWEAQYSLNPSDHRAGKVRMCLTTSFAKLSPLDVCELRKPFVDAPDEPFYGSFFKSAPERVLRLSRQSIQQGGFISICCASVRSLTVNESILVQDNLYAH